jgi:catechol-2,3-dioxygenase
MTISQDEIPAEVHQMAGVRLGGAVVFVRNLDRSVKFYTEVLGLNVADRSPTAALLSATDGPQLVLRAFGENATHPLGAVGVQYLVWMTDSQEDLDRRTELLRQRSAYRDVHSVADGVTVEGRDPDDLVLMLSYRPGGAGGLGSLPARVYAW